MKKNRRLYFGIKRFFDIVLSCLAFVVLIPLFVVVSIAIMIEDGCPIIYKQLRVGRNKKDFWVYKFRSMRKDADAIHDQMKKEYGANEVSFKLKDREDPRVLKVGHFIRKTNIDELPQLVNIIKGDMSIVGPRPLPKYEAEDTAKIYGSRFDSRYKVPQGLTCTWQVSNRGSVKYEARMQLDCEYANEASLVEDIKLIVFTFIKLVSGKGEY